MTGRAVHNYQVDWRGGSVKSAEGQLRWYRPALPR
jgi:hypothetical protein